MEDGIPDFRATRYIAICHQQFFVIIKNLKIVTTLHCSSHIKRDFNFNFNFFFLELTLQNCVGVSERGFSHLAKLNTIERLDFYRTGIEAPALKEILKASPRLKHINLGENYVQISFDENSKC